MTEKSVVEVTLSWSELLLAINAGIMRRVYAIKSGKSGVYGARDESAWDNDINGAIAEMGCAKWANVYWNGTIGITTAPDVGRWQVRSKVVEGHRLVVRPSDGDGDVFVSALVRIPDVILCGWLFGGDAKRPEWLQTYAPKPAMYFVEDQYLRPMGELKAVQARIAGRQCDNSAGPLLGGAQGEKRTSGDPGGKGGVS